MSFFTAEDLFGYLANELNYSKKDLARALGTSVSTATKWENHESIPSQENYRKMLYLAKMMDVDCSDFTIELYIEAVLSYIYEDKYSFCNIIHQTNKVKLRNSLNDSTIWVDLENLTNKKMKLF